MPAPATFIADAPLAGKPKSFQPDNPKSFIAEQDTPKFRLNPYQESYMKTGMVDPSAESFESYLQRNPTDTQLTVQKLLPTVKTPEQHEQLARFITARFSPDLPAPGVAGQLWETAWSAPKTTTDYVRTMRGIRDSEMQGTLKVRELAKAHGLDPDKLSPMPGLASRLSEGAFDAVEDLALTFQSPGGILTLGIGGLPKAAQRFVSLAFAGQMLGQAPGQAQELLQEARKPADKRDYTKIARLAVGGAASVGLGSAALVHGIKPGEMGTRVTRPSELNAEELKAAMEFNPAKAEAGAIGTSRPTIQEIRPAIRTMDGKVVVGQKGDVHNDIIAREKLKVTDVDRRLFVDAKGNAISREQLAAMGVPETEAVPGAHANELAEMQNVGKDMGFTFDGVYPAMKGEGKDLWQFTFRNAPSDDPHYGATFYTDVGATPEAILKRANEVKAKFENPPSSGKAGVGKAAPGAMSSEETGGTPEKQSASPQPSSLQVATVEWAAAEKRLRRALRQDPNDLSAAQNERDNAAINFKSITDKLNIPESVYNKLLDYVRTTDTERMPKPTPSPVKPETVGAKPRSPSEIKSLLKSAGEAADRQHIEDMGGIDNYLDQIQGRIEMATKAQAKGWQQRVVNYEKNIARAKELFPKPTPSPVKPEGSRPPQPTAKGGGAVQQLREQLKAVENEIDEARNSQSSKQAQRISLRDKLRNQITIAEQKAPQPTAKEPWQMTEKERATEPELVGMGGATRTENLSPGGSQEQQLMAALAAMKPTGGRSGLSTVPMAERLADTLAGTKDAIKRWWLNTRAGSEQIKRLLLGLGPNETGTYWDTKRDLTMRHQVNTGTALKMVDAGVKLVPDPLTRQAMGKYAEALMFDAPDQMLEEWSRTAKRTSNKRQYEMARQLTEEQKLAVRQSVQFFLAKGEELKNAGLLNHLIEDYAGQHMVDFKYNESPAEMNALRADLASGKLSTNFKYALQRMWKTEFDLEQAGYKLKTTDLFDKLANYVKTANNVLADRAAVKAWMNCESKDGRSLFASGIGRRLVEANDEHPNPALFVNPKVRPHPSVKDAKGNAIDVSGEYGKMEYPVFKKWQWAETDENGKTVWVQGDVWAHKSIIGDLRNTLESSKLYGRIPGIDAVTFANAQAKGIKLVGLFHQVKTDTHALFHLTLPWGLKDVDVNAPRTQRAMRSGLVLYDAHNAEIFSEGLASGSLLHKLESGVARGTGVKAVGSKVASVLPGAAGSATRELTSGQVLKDYQEFLFQWHIPRVKLAVFEDALGRNMQRYGVAPEGVRGAVTRGMRQIPVVRKLRPIFTEEQIWQLTAHQVNSAFGLVNWRLYGINPTFQHALRLAVLAPDFQAAQTGFMAQQFSRFGAEQRMAAAIMIASVYTTARVLNEIFDKDPHWELKHAFSVVYGGRAYSFRTVASDVMRAFTSTHQFVYHKLSPMLSGMGEWLTGVDVLGRKETSGMAYKNIAERLVPIPVTPRSDLGFFEGAMAGTFGYYENRVSPYANIRSLAGDWMKKSKDPKVQAALAEREQSSYPESVYRDLNYALADNDRPKVIKEYNKLLDGGRSAKEIVSHFKPNEHMATGSLREETLFRLQLDTKGIQAYSNAQTERKRQFNALLSVMPPEQVRTALWQTPETIRRVAKLANVPQLQAAAIKMSLPDAVSLWDELSEAQKVQIAPVMAFKVGEAANRRSVDPDTLARYVRLTKPYVIKAMQARSQKSEAESRNGNRLRSAAFQQ